MPSADDPKVRKREATYSPAQKAALILLSMDQRKAAEIVSAFSRSEAASIEAALLNLPEATTGSVRSAVEEFENGCNAALQFLGTASNIIEMLPKEDVALQTPEVPAVWPRIAQIESDALASYLTAQPKQFAAYVISRLPPEAAAGVMKLFDAELQSTLISLLMVMRPASVSVDRICEKVIESGLLTAAGSRPTNHGMVARILNQLDEPQADFALAQLTNRSPNDATAIKRLLFRFGHLAELSDAALAAVVDRLPVERLVLALHGASAALQEALLSKMAPRARRMAEAELRSGTPTPEVEVTAARAFIEAEVIRMAIEGNLILDDRTQR